MTQVTLNNLENVAGGALALNSDLLSDLSLAAANPDAKRLLDKSDRLAKEIPPCIYRLDMDLISDNLLGLLNKDRLLSTKDRPLNKEIY